MENRFIYAGFWLRFVASIIDFVIICIAAVILNLLIPFLSFNFIQFTLGAVYFIYLESSEYQATFGKMALGIKVTNMKSGRIIPSEAAIRFISKIISGLILGIGLIMVAFTEKKQGLHDIIANTLVIQAASLEEIDAHEKSENSLEINPEKVENLPIVAV